MSSVSQVSSSSSSQYSQPFPIRFFGEIEGDRNVIIALGRDKNVLGTGTDEEQRTLFVVLQGAIEAKLAQSQEITNLFGVIHTPTPATPLCTLPDTTAAPQRARIIRDYLERGKQLIALYPIEGLWERSQDQLKIFKEAKSQYQSLEDHPFNGKLPDGLSGASYFFTADGEQYLFSIKATQVHIKGGNMEMWFGPINNEKIRPRYEEIKAFLEQQNVTIGRA